MSVKETKRNTHEDVPFFKKKTVDLLWYNTVCVGHDNAAGAGDSVMVSRHVCRYGGLRAG